VLSNVTGLINVKLLKDKSTCFKLLRFFQLISSRFCRLVSLSFNVSKAEPSTLNISKLSRRLNEKSTYLVELLRNASKEMLVLAWAKFIHSIRLRSSALAAMEQFK
jgi:hypothetical protein